MDLRWNLEYCTEQLTRQLNALEPIIKKLYLNPGEPLSIEENYKLREALVSIETHVNMMNCDLAEPEPKKGFFKRLLNK